MGRGSRQRSLPECAECNDNKVSAFGRSQAIEMFELKFKTDMSLRIRLW